MEPTAPSGGRLNPDGSPITPDPQPTNKPGIVSTVSGITNRLFGQPQEPAPTATPALETNPPALPQTPQFPQTEGLPAPAPDPGISTFREGQIGPTIEPGQTTAAPQLPAEPTFPAQDQAQASPTPQADFSPYVGTPSQEPQPVVHPAPPLTEMPEPFASPTGQPTPELPPAIDLTSTASAQPIETPTPRPVQLPDDPFAVKQTETPQAATGTPAEPPQPTLEQANDQEDPQTRTKRAVTLLEASELLAGLTEPELDRLREVIRRFDDIIKGKPVSENELRVVQELVSHIRGSQLKDPNQAPAQRPITVPNSDITNR